MDYAVNRIYSSEQARFLQPDPIGMASADLTDPQSLNMYSYARNNPIDLVDPSGTNARRPSYRGMGFFGFCSAQYSYSDCGGRSGFLSGNFGDHVARRKRRLGGATGKMARALERHLLILQRGYDPETGHYKGEVKVQLLDEKGKTLVHETVMQKPTLEEVRRQMSKYAEAIARNQIREKFREEGITADHIELTHSGKGFTFTVTNSDGAKKIEGFLDDTTRFSKSTNKFHYWFHAKKLNCGSGDCTDYRSRKGYMSSGSMQIVYNRDAGKHGGGYIDVDKYAAHGSGLLQTLGHGLEVLGGGGLPSVPRVEYRGLPIYKGP